MDTEELLTDLQRLGVVLMANGGRLQVDAPKGIITPAIRAELARHKVDLLALLASGGQALDPTEPPTQEAYSPPVAQPSTPAAPASDRPELPPWAAELPCVVEDWPELRARWGLDNVRLTWPEGAAGLVAEVWG